MDNILLASGYYHGILVDITSAMVQIHQGRDTYRNTRMKGKNDAKYNMRFLKNMIKLSNSKYSVVKVGRNYALRSTRKPRSKRYKH